MDELEVFCKWIISQQPKLNIIRDSQNKHIMEDIMFDFLFGPDYEERKVANTVLKDGSCIDTCAVTDTDANYETGIQSPFYNNNSWVIVEEYDTLDEAKKGHKKWCDAMAKKPKQLVDVSRSTAAQLCKDDTLIFKRKDLK